MTEFHVILIAIVLVLMLAGCFMMVSGVRPIHDKPLTAFGKSVRTLLGLLLLTVAGMLVYGMLFLKPID